MSYGAGIPEKDWSERRWDWVRIPRVPGMFGTGMVDPEVTMEPGNFAHGVWAALAATLAAPLHKALNEHLDAHGCACPGGPHCDARDRHEEAGGHPTPGFSHCREARRLFEMLPDLDKVIIA